MVPIARGSFALRPFINVIHLSSGHDPLEAAFFRLLFLCNSPSVYSPSRLTRRNQISLAILTRGFIFGVIRFLFNTVFVVDSHLANTDRQFREVNGKANSSSIPSTMNFSRLMSLRHPSFFVDVRDVQILLIQSLIVAPPACRTKAAALRPKLDKFVKWCPIVSV